MSRRTHEPTPEQKARAEQRRAAFRTLAEQIAAMDEEQRLTLADRMGGCVTVEGHPLSVGNQCLLALQCPTATVVGGFQQWLRAGRVVSKGQHGHMIWAPVKPRAGDGSQDGAADPQPAGVMTTERQRFIMITVFDVAQTQPKDESEVAA